MCAHSQHPPSTWGETTCQRGRSSALALRGSRLGEVCAPERNLLHAVWFPPFDKKPKALAYALVSLGFYSAMIYSLLLHTLHNGTSPLWVLPLLMLLLPSRQPSDAFSPRPPRGFQGCLWCQGYTWALQAALSVLPGSGVFKFPVLASREHGRH